MTNTYKTLSTLTLGGEPIGYYSLPALAQQFPGVARLPYSLKILLENLLRREDGAFVKADDIRALASWTPGASATKEISFMPARVLLQDFTGVPVRGRPGGHARRHRRARRRPREGQSAAAGGARHRSLGAGRSLRHAPTRSQLNAELEYHRNRERYVFLRWGQTAFRNFRVVPPETGIVHQVNIEYLARVVCRDTRGRPRRGVSRHRVRHRLAHDDGERPRRGGLGRRRHRGRGGDARPAELDADPAGASATG